MCVVRDAHSEPAHALQRSAERNLKTAVRRRCEAKQAHFVPQRLEDAPDEEVRYSRAIDVHHQCHSVHILRAEMEGGGASERAEPAASMAGELVRAGGRAPECESLRVAPCGS